MVIMNNEKEIIKQKRIQGTPSLLIEIVISNKKRDLEDKKEIYERHKVKEYVIIEPEQNFVLVYRLNEDGKFNQPLKINLPGKITLKTLNNLELELKSIN